MRYISNEFKEIQGRIIRPPLKLYFEVNSATAQSLTAQSDNLNLDTDNAPLVKPDICTNEHYYAIIGDDVPVDDPNRICVPFPTGTFPTPDTTVPYGVTPYVEAGNHYRIADTSHYYYNFNGIPEGLTLSFKGGLIPDYVKVERYNTNEGWQIDHEFDNSELKEELSYETDIQYAGWFRRINVGRSDKSGRFQLNWLKNHRHYAPVVFKNNRISSVKLDLETDLTSQTLPSYEMTVTCLDVNGEYTPDSVYWKENFAIVPCPCLLKVGYEVAGKTEYIPLMFGNLKEKPSYSQGKITFKVAVSWRASQTFPANFISIVNNTLNEGDIVDNATFKSIIARGRLFDSYDVFHGEVDEYGSECNYYGVVDLSEVRQLVANAMGCFITAGINRVDLHNTNDIQYKAFNNTYLTRYEQSKNELVNKPKAGTINVTRNEYTLLDEYEEVEADEAISITADGEGIATFTLPMFAFGKAVISDAQSSDPTATINVVTVRNEVVNSEGLYETAIWFSSDKTTTIQPIVRFYKVNRAEYQEGKNLNSDLDETYYNDNFLVANGYNASKVKRVAEFMSDIPNVYEVDVMPDFSREVGDVIRLETEKNVFKTCVITGMTFNLPGSKAHITCRKIFSPLDSAYIAMGATNQFPIVATQTGYYDYKIKQSPTDACVVGKITYTMGGTHSIFFVLGATEMQRYVGGEPSSVYHGDIAITDDNKHVWQVYCIPANHETAVTPVVDLGTYDSTGTVGDEDAYGAIKFIIALYNEQGMTSPVNYDSEYERN